MARKIFYGSQDFLWFARFFMAVERAFLVIQQQLRTGFILHTKVIDNSGAGGV